MSHGLIYQNDKWNKNSCQYYQRMQIISWQQILLSQKSPTYTSSTTTLYTNVVLSELIRRLLYSINSVYRPGQPNVQKIFNVILCNFAH